MLFFLLSSKQTQQAFISRNNKHKIGTLENPRAGLWETHSLSGQVFGFGCRGSGASRGARLTLNDSGILKGEDSRGKDTWDLPLNHSSGRWQKGAQGLWDFFSSQDILLLSLEISLKEKIKIIQRLIFI